MEREIQNYFENKYAKNTKISLYTPKTVGTDGHNEATASKKRIDFSLTPEEVEDFLNIWITGQEEAKATISTKICTHFRRLVCAQDKTGAKNIKNNIMLMGPTGVGKTYMIRLLASWLNVPFIKADATKFSETGYVGGDVDDIVRSLVAEADGNIELAENGIIYLDEVDKIAAPYPKSNLDVSRGGVQRTLLKLLEETEVEIIPSKNTARTESGPKDKYKNIISTKNILFIASGAFSGIDNIIKNRQNRHGIGFGSEIKKDQADNNLKNIRPADLIEYGFETEFIGRFPVIIVLNPLGIHDLYQILKNPNSQIITSKKIDFLAYGIEFDIEDDAIAAIAELASKEETGARGLIAALERILMPFEKKLPSTQIKSFILTKDMVKNPEKGLSEILSQKHY